MRGGCETARVGVPVRPGTIAALMRAAVLIALAMSFGLSAHASEAFHARCERRLPAGELVFDYKPGEVSYDNTAGMLELTERSGSMKHSRGTLGTTEFELTYTAHVSTKALEDGQTGKACGRIVAWVELRLAPLRVSVARELPKGSCAYAHVAEHEMKHVAINEHHLQAVAAELTARAASQVAHRTFFGDEEALRAQMLQYVTDSWIPEVRVAMDKVKAQHARLDSPEEYARNETVCGATIGAIAREALARD